MLLSHDVAGAGDSVLLVHAGVADRRMWEPQWAALAERFRVVRCDLRGFGETPLPPGRFSNADDIATLLDHLGIERTAIVGASFGGRVTLEFASARPERVDRLVLLATGFDGVEPTVDAEAFDTRENELAEAEDLDGLVELNVETWLGPEADDAAKDLVRRMQRHAFEVQIAAEKQPDPPQIDWTTIDPARIGCPTVLFSGDHDMDFFRAIAVHLANVLPKARLVDLDWAGHLPSLERPAEATELILEALAAEL